MLTAPSVLVSWAEGKLEMEKAPVSGRALLTCPGAGAGGGGGGQRKRFLGGVGGGKGRGGG